MIQTEIVWSAIYGLICERRDGHKNISIFLNHCKNNVHGTSFYRCCKSNIGNEKKTINYIEKKLKILKNLNFYKWF